MRREDRRSDCPTNHALEAFGDSWSLLILRDMMFRGKRTFAEFMDSEERISTNILASRLKSLADHGLIRKDGDARRPTYSLTRRGIDLLPTMVELILWSTRHDPGSRTPPFLPRLRKNKRRYLAEMASKLKAAHAPGSP